MYNVQICPVRELYRIAADADLSETAAIIVSSYPVKTDALGDLASRIIFGFADTVEAGRDDAFDREAARQIRDFVEGLPRDLDTLFVCCDSGESRSSAMAAAIMRFCGMDEWRVWDDPKYHPNRLVYTLLCRELGMDVSAFDVFMRRMRNRRAFRNAGK